MGPNVPLTLYEDGVLVCDGLSWEAVGAAAVRVDETRVSLGERYLANPCAACRVENMLFIYLIILNISDYM